MGNRVTASSTFLHRVYCERDISIVVIVCAALYISIVVIVCAAAAVIYISML